MIKIELKNSKSILKFHYENLTKKNGRQWTVETYLKSKKTKHTGNAALVDMYNDLLLSVLKDSTGFSILIASPADLETFIQLFELKHSAVLSPAVRLEIANCFYYSDYDKWKSYELARMIGLSVCPYCNRSYTFTVGTDTKKGTRFEYDHFFSKSAYPYLGLSFYNLVPSCHICNSNFKGKKEFSLNSNIHPYIEGFGNEIVFSLRPKNVNFINGKSESYRIRFKTGLHGTWNNQKIKAAFENITTFQLTKLYNLHKDYVDEIIQKSIIYNEDYITQLFNDYGGSLFKNKEEVKRMILGNYISQTDYPKRVLSKLTADISRELGLI